MEGQENIAKKPRKKTVRRIIQIISGILLVLLIFIFFVIPAILSSDKGRQVILSKINNALEDGKAEISGLSIPILKTSNLPCIKILK